MGLALASELQEEDGEAKEGGEGDADVADAHREAGGLCADLSVEGLQIPEDRDAEEEHAAYVKKHSHLRFSVAVEHAEDGGVDGEGEDGERVVSVDRLDQDDKLGGAVGKLVLVVEADYSILEYEADEHVADDAKNGRHHE